MCRSRRAQGGCRTHSENASKVTQQQTRSEQKKRVYLRMETFSHRSRNLTYTLLKKTTLSISSPLICYIYLTLNKLHKLLCICNLYPGSCQEPLWPPINEVPTQQSASLPQLESLSLVYSEERVHGAVCQSYCNLTSLLIVPV